MKTGLLIVTHGRLGRYLLDTVQDMLGELPCKAEILEVRRVHNPEALVRQGRRVLERLDDGAGVLILTDAHGSTPGNIATQIADSAACRVVAGVNLPMLIRVFNYPDRTLDELAETAIEGGRRGIIDCEN